MNVIGISGLSNSVAFKQKEFPGCSKREYQIGQGFDAAAALVGSQGVIAAAAEERFTREKATGAFPLNAIRYCLQAANLGHHQVDLIAHGFSYEPFKSFFEADEYARRQYQEIYSPDVQRRFLDQYLGETIWSEKLFPVPHHLAHAASALYPSGFEEALILISDGMGEVHSMTVAVGKGTEMTVLAQIPAFHSLGILYGVFTLYLGFYMGSDEYKVMGLAPYGNPDRFFKQMSQFVSLKSDGTYAVPIFSHNHTPQDRETHAGVLRFLAEQFGPAREPEEEIAQFHKDIAAALQLLLQNCQLHVLEHFQRETGQKNLCLAGGVALNCSANGVIKRSGLFERVFVQPAAGDDGCALGAALYAQRLHDPQFKRHKMTVPLWGPDFAEEDIRRVLADREDCWVVEMECFEAVCAEVAARIDKGQIVAWFQGRMEFGPRALGGRSILADPRDPAMRDRINSLVKKREGFRPFAPVVTHEAAARIFQITAGEEDTYAHMLFVTHVRPEYVAKLPATTHVDGSARIQTVAREHNPRLWQLLNEFEKLSGLPVLLNTSFNVRGQPIVCTPQEALDTFLFANLDVLVAGNILVIPRRIKTVSARRPTSTPDALSRPEATEPDSPSIRRRTELYAAAVRHEEFWVHRLAAMEAVALPYKRRELSLGRSQDWAKLDQPLPREVLSFLDTNRAAANRSELLLAAFGVFLARITGLEAFDVGFLEWTLRSQLDGFDHLFAAVLPLRLEVNPGLPFAEALAAASTAVENVRSHKTYARDVLARYPVLRGTEDHPKKAGLPVVIQLARTSGESAPVPEAELMLVLGEQSVECLWIYDANVFDAETISAMASQFVTLLQGIAGSPRQPVAEIPLLTEREHRQVLLEWNNTRTPFPTHLCIHEMVEMQAQRTPEAAVIFEDQQLSYAELDRRANRLAQYLCKLGVGPEVLVGICMEVSIEMLVGLLGVLKAGGGYVPLDPHYPKERLGFMIRDARLPVLLTQQSLLGFLQQTMAQTAAPPNDAGSSSPVFEATVICLDTQWGTIGKESAEAPATGVMPENLAYVIYTSGSTGKPKGVMVTHRNVANFFAGMDSRIGAEPPGVWLAVTSISFDISVLELFWTLARGFKLVLQRKGESITRSPATLRASANRPIDFSLFYFASDESAADAKKYRLLLDGAKFADEHGFAAVWTPERHFHAFGGLYPNPSVTSAAIAAVTSRVQIRAGSVVLPLHNPIRVAEEWAVVDNLSNGRVGISFASGWQVNDFVLAPENYAQRKEIMLRQIQIVRQLWRGETVSFSGAKGQDVPVKILPRPIQPELPIWITASGNPETFRVAGELGANLLTHLLGQSIVELAEKIAAYRAGWKQKGHAGAGRVTLMLHTFVGENLETVREVVRQPMTAYLRSSIDLIKNAPLTFSAFKRPVDAPATSWDSAEAKFTEEELSLMSKHAFERYFETSGLFGTPELCLDRVDQLRALGVDEIACLIDFGVDDDLAFGSLHYLDRVRREANPRAKRDAADHSLPNQLARHQVTHFQCTPSLAAMLAEEPNGLQGLRSLRKLMLGGEALPADLVRQLNISGELLNMYGPTETTIWSTTHRVNKADKTIPIGRPIANTEIYILDKNLQPVPVGVPGEILIGGAGVVRGYRNQPQLTAEKFIPHPFTSDSTARLYKTGDLARYGPDGQIEFLGRIDQQVKLRGFRIELGEIEAALRQHPQIKDCAALVREDKPGDKRLVAYVVAGPGQSPDAKSLREFLHQKLPDYMVPSAFVALPALPLTPNGKLDRKALPEPDGMAGPARTFVAPTSPAEKKVAQVWCEVLGVKEAGIQDNFFELGGNSVLATQLISRLREAFKWELPLRLAFEFPTVEALAKALPLQSTLDGEVLLPHHQVITPRKNPAEAPLSFAQQRMWFLDQLEPGPHYNDHFDLRLTGPLQAGTLEKALNEIVRRHDTLRCTFAKLEGSPVQIIAPTLRLPVPLIDLCDRPRAEREPEAVRRAVEQSRQLFDLEKGPLLRASLLRLAEAEHILLLTFHHIIIDGWSRGVFLRELTALYQAFLAGRPSPLPELTIQYADFAAWQQQWLHGKSIEHHLVYWKQQLLGAPALLELPADRPRPAVQSYRGARQPFEINQATIDQLSTLGRQEGCTLFMVFVAAFQTLLARCTGREDIVIGSPIAHRNHAEIEGLLGNFLNTLVLRSDLSGDPPFLHLLRRIRKVALDAYAHQDLPFEKLVAGLQPVRRRGFSPVFQVMFILQNAPRPIASSRGLAFKPFEIDTGISKLDLTLNLEETPQGCLGWIEYATDLFDLARIERLIADFKGLLNSIAVRPNDRLSQAEE